MPPDLLRRPRRLGQDAPNLARLRPGLVHLPNTTEQHPQSHHLLLLVPAAKPPTLRADVARNILAQNDGVAQSPELKSACEPDWVLTRPGESGILPLVVQGS